MNYVFICLFTIVSHLAIAADCLNLELVKADLTAAAKTRGKPNRTELVDVKLINALITPERLSEVIDDVLKPTAFLSGIANGNIKQIKCEAVEFVSSNLILDVTAFTETSLDLVYNVAGLRAFTDNAAETILTSLVTELTKAGKAGSKVKVVQQEGESFDDFIERAATELGDSLASQISKVLLEKLADPTERKLMLENMSNQFFTVMQNSIIRVSKLSPTRYEVKQEQPFENQSQILRTEITALDDEPIKPSLFLIGLREIAAKKAAKAK